jgi:hypothetical protein
MKPRDPRAGIVPKVCLHPGGRWVVGLRLPRQLVTSRSQLSIRGQVRGRMREICVFWGLAVAVASHSYRMCPVSACIVLSSVVSAGPPLGHPTAMLRFGLKGPRDGRLHSLTPSRNSEIPSSAPSAAKLPPSVSCSICWAISVISCRWYKMQPRSNPKGVPSPFTLLRRLLSQNRPHIHSVKSHVHLPSHRPSQIEAAGETNLR